MLDPASIFYHAAHRGVSPRGSQPRVAVVPMERVRAPQVATVTPAPPARDATPLDPPAETMGWLRANTGAETGPNAVGMELHTFAITKLPEGYNKGSAR